MYRRSGLRLSVVGATVLLSSCASNIAQVRLPFEPQVETHAPPGVLLFGRARTEGSITRVSGVLYQAWSSEPSRIRFVVKEEGRIIHEQDLMPSASSFNKKGPRIRRFHAVVKAAMTSRSVLSLTAYPANHDSAS